MDSMFNRLKKYGSDFDSFRNEFDSFMNGGGGGGRRRTVSTRRCLGGRGSQKQSREVRRNPFASLDTQNYDEIKKHCQETGQKFEDPEFEAVDSSVFYSQPPRRPFEWLRPDEIVDNPQWVSDGASRFDVKQGELGDCWLLAAVASLTCNPTLFNKVVDTSQNFTNDYCGIFKFNFWHEGEWKEVVVDDRLPTCNGQLVFMHSAEKCEFWSALLEKAYAKLVGSYESLKGGSTSEAMEDFTGGVTEMFDLSKAPPNLLRIMIKAHERGSLMGCSIDADPNVVEAELANGLIMGHAYSITSVMLADIETPRFSGKIPMVRIRNPWGNEAEWKGAWSDNSREWSLLSAEEREELGFTKSDDGEFWMSYQDFTSNFQKLEICNLGPDSLEEEDLTNRKKWECHKEHTEWVKRVNAGGCRNYLETFWTNPQFRMTLTDPDDDDDDDLCTALIAILQKDRRKKRKEGLDLLTIGYVIYKIENPDSPPLDMNFFKYNASVAKSPTFINMREVCGRHKLPPGTYAIIPSTFEPNFEGKFLLRIFTEKANVSGEMDQQTCITSVDTPQIPQGPAQPARPVDFIEQQIDQVAVYAEEVQASGFNTPATEQEVAEGEQLKEKFRAVCGDDMEIDAFELREVLNCVFTNRFSFDGFGIDTCRSMVAMHDGDLSGKLGYEEFRDLWNDLRQWKSVFKKHDTDNSGKLSSMELRAALNTVGFRISNKCILSLIMRYSDKRGNIEFGDFIVCSIRLKTMLSSFQARQRDNIGFFDIDTFIQTTMYS